MTIQDLGNAGEFIASIATLATLVYLTLQIRQNTATLQMGAVQQALCGIAEFNKFMASDATLVALFHRGLGKPVSSARRNGFDSHLSCPA